MAEDRSHRPQRFEIEECHHRPRDRTILQVGIDTHVPSLATSTRKDGRSHDDETDRNETAQESVLLRGRKRRSYA